MLACSSCTFWSIIFTLAVLCSRFYRTTVHRCCAVHQVWVPQRSAAEFVRQLQTDHLIREHSVENDREVFGFVERQRARSVLVWRLPNRISVLLLPSRGHFVYYSPTALTVKSRLSAAPSGHSEGFWTNSAPQYSSSCTNMHKLSRPTFT